MEHSFWTVLLTEKSKTIARHFRQKKLFQHLFVTSLFAKLFNFFTLHNSKTNWFFNANLKQKSYFWRKEHESDQVSVTNKRVSKWLIFRRKVLSQFLTHKVIFKNNVLKTLFWTVDPPVFAALVKQYIYGNLEAHMSKRSKISFF